MYKNGILVLTIVALLLTTSSCGSAAASSLSQTTQPSSALSGTVSTDASGLTPTVTAKITESSSSATAATESAKESTAAPTKAFVPDQNLDGLLDKVTNYEEGTAGSSLKQAKIAGELLDWTEDSSLTSKEMDAQIAYYLQGVGTSALVDQFTSHFSDVSKTVLLIINKDSYALSSLTDAGYTPTHSQYTLSKWNAFAAAVQLESDAS
jgi:hypothetical protein